MRKKTLKEELLKLSEQILEIKKVQVLVGKNKKPIDRPDVIIFHIDI